MVRKTGDQSHELTAADGVGLRVTAAGPASIDVTAIPLPDGTLSPITSSMSIVSTWPGAAPGSLYTIEVSDLARGAVVDTIRAPLSGGAANRRSSRTAASTGR